MKKASRFGSGATLSACFIYLYLSVLVGDKCNRCDNFLCEWSEKTKNKQNNLHVFFWKVAKKTNKQTKKDTIHKNTDWTETASVKFVVTLHAVNVGIAYKHSSGKQGNTATVFYCKLGVIPELKHDYCVIFCRELLVF